jgi:hypothetical protein
MSVTEESETPYIDLFYAHNLNNKFVGKTNLYEICVTIMADHEYLSNSNLSRDIIFKNSYENININDTSLSILNIAKTIINLYSQNIDEEFAQHLFLKNWRSMKPVDDEVIDPYSLKSYEYKRPLTKLSLMTIVRALRFYLFETINRSFPLNLQPEERLIANSSYSVISNERYVKRQSDAFHAVFTEFLKLASQISLLSDDLTEITNIIENAVKTGKEEKAKKTAERIQTKKNIQKIAIENKKNIPQIIKSENTNTNTNLQTINWLDNPLIILNKHLEKSDTNTTSNNGQINLKNIISDDNNDNNDNDNDNDEKNVNDYPENKNWLPAGKKKIVKQNIMKK